MNPFEPPIQQPERSLRSSWKMLVLFLGCIAMVLLGVAVSCHATNEIMLTTPAMGIPVDANGNRIPIQGYPQLWFGLSSVLLFAVLAIVFGWLWRKQKVKNRWIAARSDNRKLTF